ncbi:hypothetical protein [Vibrio maritimus]|uniref:hypothetical protein n=1 Tax=Vibrio maritimus TaxID=990268 RepID=UPI001F35A33F|nr:hypothetical protein [Vibrio maritimus]
MLSRKNLQAQERQLKQEEFVDSAEGTAIVRKVGRPKLDREKREPVTLSLTKTETKNLDAIPKRINFLSYSNGENVELNRSDFIRLMTERLSSMSDDELYKWYKGN